MYFIQHIIFLCLQIGPCQFAPIQLTELAAYVFALGKLLGRTFDRITLMDLQGWMPVSIFTLFSLPLTRHWSLTPGRRFLLGIFIIAVWWRNSSSVEQEGSTPCSQKRAMWYYFSQISPVPMIITYSLRIYFIIILATSIPYKYSPAANFLIKISINIIFSFMPCIYPALSYLLLVLSECSYSFQNCNYIT